MPEDTDHPTLDNPHPRRTAMAVATEAAEVALAALEMAQNAIDAQDRLGEKLTDVATRLGDLQAPVIPELPDIAAMVETQMGPVRKTLEEAQGAMAVVQQSAVPETRFRAFVEEVGGYQGAVNRKLDDLRTRAAELEGWREGVSARLTQDLDSERIDGMARQVANIEQELARREADPAAVALEEDHISDVVERLVRERLDAILARLEAVERRETMYTATATVEARGGGTGAQRKVLELMRRVDVIAKDRQAEKNAGGYRFRGIDEALDAVGRAMRDIGLIGSPQVRSVEYANHTATNSQGKSILWTTARLVGEYVFIDPDDGSAHPIQLVGEGRDNSDKATSKASSMALKYGLLHGLMIPVTGMPDGDAENPEVVNEQQPATPPAPDQPEPSPQDRAQRAVAAFQQLDRVDGQERYNRFVLMSNHARAANLMDIMVEWKGERAPLHYFVTSVERLLMTTPPPADHDGHNYGEGGY